MVALSGGETLRHSHLPCVQKNGCSPPAPVSRSSVMGR